MINPEKLVAHTVFDEKGHPYRLAKVVGRGGQGVVFEADGGDFMVKIVTVKDVAHRQELQRRYRWLLNRVIDPDIRLVMPEAILAAPYTGYVMRRVRGHEPLTRLFAPDPSATFGKWFNQQTGGLRRRLLLGALVARVFDTLHLGGLAYCDLSDTNILVARDPNLLSICLIDSDNLSVSGQAQSLVLGTPLYMAPEVIAGRHQPDSLTDSYSLAVILFRLLRLGHPLIGDVVANGPPEVEERALLGEFPYIDHPDDSSNRSSTTLPSEAMCSKELSELFLRTFTDGIKGRMARPTPAEWAEACLVTADKTTRCTHCSASFFPRSEHDQKHWVRCPWCGMLNAKPPMLLIREVTVDDNNKPIRAKKIIGSMVLGEGGNFVVTAQYALNYRQGKDGDQVIAIIHLDPEKDKVIIQNKSDFDFLLIQPGKSWETLKKHSNLELDIDANIFFGQPTKDKIVRYGQIVRNWGE